MHCPRRKLAYAKAWLNNAMCACLCSVGSCLVYTYRVQALLEMLCMLIQYAVCCPRCPGMNWHSQLRPHLCHRALCPLLQCLLLEAYQIYCPQPQQAPVLLRLQQPSWISSGTSRTTWCCCTALVVPKRWRASLWCSISLSNGPGAQPCGGKRYLSLSLELRMRAVCIASSCVWPCHDHGMC